MVGRSAERARLEEALRRAARGDGNAVAVLGAPGSGRTALLATASQQAAADGWIVRRGAGRRSEAHVDGAVVHELLGGAVVEPSAVTDAIRQLGTERPCLVTVDDLHLADGASALAVLYAARRLVGARVAVLLSLGAGSDHDLSGIERLELDGLAEHEVEELFAAVAGPVASAVVQRVMHLTAGNPLAVIDLARRSTPEQRSGVHAISDLPEVSEALVLSFAEPLRALSDPARRALCVAAAEPTGRLDVIAGALARLGDSIDALEAAEAIGVVTLAEGRVAFDHPMRRVVAYASLAIASRRAAHRALAAAWADPAVGVERVRHLVAGAVGPDDSLADDVQLIAEHLGRTGRDNEARTAWRAAAALSVDPRRKAAREQRAEATTSATQQPPVSGPLAALSPAELRVATVIAEGLTNKQTAERLFLSAKTVDAHLQSIFRKLQVNTRAQLAVTVARSTS
ncbi:MAG TPA: LuxR C-terminal-related transcriptional regulator [Ilumatobacteraceae bacterium]|nr:LuxR C-terminal-related transcriptional regulator [Ilumatobacteraceae bacterium]